MGAAYMHYPPPHRRPTHSPVVRPCGVFLMDCSTLPQYPVAEEYSMTRELCCEWFERAPVTFSWISLGFLLIVVTSSSSCRDTVDPCSLHDDCRNYGYCASQDGKCAATQDEHCRAAEVCGFGKGQHAKNASSFCFAKNGVCSPTNASCRESDSCWEIGACAIGPTGTCAPSSDDDCRQSQSCRALGLCHKTNDSFCRAASDSDCAGSETCKTDGACHHDGDGWCAAKVTQ